MKSFFIISFAIFLCINNCNREKQIITQLTEIGHLAESNPDSALKKHHALYHKIDKMSHDYKTYYNFQKIKIEYKTGIPQTSDSLICNIAHYYEKHNKKNFLPEVYYYVGQINSELHHTEKALVYLYMALAIDSTELKKPLKNKIYEQIAHIYLRNKLYDDAIELYQLAYFFYKQENDTKGVENCRKNIAAIKKKQVKTSCTDSLRHAKAMKIRALNIQAIKQCKELNLMLTKKNNMTEKFRIMTICILSSVTLFLFILYTFFYREKNTRKDRNSYQIKKIYNSKVNQMFNNHIKANKILKATDWAMAESAILLEIPSFKDKLYSYYNFSEMEYHICILIKLGVSPSNMAKLLATSNSNISLSRLRMQQKIFQGKGSAKEWDAFILAIQ